MYVCIRSRDGARAVPGSIGPRSRNDDRRMGPNIENSR